MKLKIPYSLLLLLLLSFSSCISFINLSEAETIGKGKQAIEIAAYAFGNPDKSPDALLSNDWIPMAKALYQYGLSDNLNLELGASTGFMLELGFKYKVLQSPKYTFSLRPSAEVLPLKNADFNLSPSFALLQSFKVSDHSNILVNVNIASTFVTNEKIHYNDAYLLGYMWQAEKFRIKAGISALNILGNYFGEEQGFIIAPSIGANFLF